MLSLTVTPFINTTVLPQDHLFDVYTAPKLNLTDQRRDVGVLHQSLANDVLQFER